MNELYKDKKMIIAILVLWGGLIIIGLVLTIMGIRILTGAASGTKLMLPVGALVLIRSVIKVIGLKKQIAMLNETSERPAEPGQEAEK